MRVHWTKYLTLAVAIFALTWVVVAQEAQKKEWKDRAEYDLYESILKEQNANTALKLLDEYKQKYPETDYAFDRLLLYLNTYVKLNQTDKVLDTAKEILKVDPNDMRGLYYGTLLTVSRQDTSPAALEFGEKCSTALLKNLDNVFAESKKPAGTSDADWKNERTKVEVMAHNTLGWIAMQRKDNNKAEMEFHKVIELNATNAQASYWLGTVILAQRNPDKQSIGLYNLARASEYTGEGALPQATRTQITDYLKKVYVNFHGSEDGLDDILGRAKSDPFPPANFVIKSKAQMEMEALNKLREDNPNLYFWQEVIRKPLSGPNGEEFWTGRLKDAILPPSDSGLSSLAGRVVSQNPPNRPTEVTLAIAGSNPEVRLKFPEPMRLPAAVGSTIRFKGPARAFTQSPFMITFEVDNDSVIGWPKPGGPARK